jgi:hypothetical protein
VGEVSKKMFLEEAAADIQSKHEMRADMMIVGMTLAEQQQHLCHDDTCGVTLTPSTPAMPHRHSRGCGRRILPI